MENKTSYTKMALKRIICDIRILNKLCKNLDIYYNIRPSGTEPLLRVNLQYEKRNIKVSILNKLKTQIIKVISDAC